MKWAGFEISRFTATGDISPATPFSLYTVTQAQDVGKGRSLRAGAHPVRIRRGRPAKWDLLVQW
jgi:hypothetical protein